MIALNEPPLLSLREDLGARPNAASATAAVAYSTAGALLPGARGTGESTANNTATGGIGGAVIIFY